MDFFTGEKMLHPLSDAPEPKSRHIPSKWEHKRVSKSFILYVTTDSNETRTLAHKIIIIVRFTTLPLVMCLGHWSNLVSGENVLI